MNWKKPLAKLHLSVVVLVLVIAAFFIFVATPVQFYDRHVIEKATQCAKDLTAKYAANKPAFDPDAYLAKKKAEKDWDKTPPTKEELAKIKSKTIITDEEMKKLEESDWVDVPTDETFAKECEVKVTWDTYSKDWDYHSYKVLNDNSPRPVDMLLVGLAFIGFALALMALRKWVIWLFR